MTAFRRALPVLSLSVLAAAVVIRAQAPSPPPAQGTPPATFRVATESVDVDVVVVDKTGAPVRGLTKNDFTILDRRRPQTIDLFDEIHPPPASAASSVPSLANLPPATRIDVSTNVLAPTDRLVVIVLDDLHTYRGRADTVKKIARDLVDRLGPRSSMALLLTGGDNSVEVTSDRSRLLGAIDAFKPRRAERRPIQACDSHFIRADVESNAPPSDQGCDRQELNADLSLYKTLEEAARMLGGHDSRRRVFVLVSENLAKDLTGLFQVNAPPGSVVDSGNYATGGADALANVPNPVLSQHDISLLNMMQAFRQGGVVTYSIDPRGEVQSRDIMRECQPNLTGWAESKPLNDPCEGETNAPQDWSNWIRQSQHGLERLSEASGGFAVVNTNDFDGGIDRIASDLDNYYLLGFSLKDTTSKGPRALRVQVRNHPEYVLRYRPFYEIGGDARTPSKVDPLVALVNAPIAGGDLAMRLHAVAMPYSDKEARVAVALELSVPRDSMASGGEQAILDEIRYGIFAIDLKGAKVRQQTGSGARIALRPKPGVQTAPDQVTYQIAASLQLPPGRYQLRAAVTSTKLGTGGSAYLSVDVPDFQKAPIGVSDLLVGYADGPHVPIAHNQARADVPAANLLPFDPTLDRTFHTADTLRLYFKVVTARPLPVTATVSALAPDGRVVLTFDKSLSAAAPALDTRLPLQQLGPGAYRLHVKVSDGTNTAERDIGFVVK